MKVGRIFIITLSHIIVNPCSEFCALCILIIQSDESDRYQFTGFQIVIRLFRVELGIQCEPDILDVVRDILQYDRYGCGVGRKVNRL